jgi:hypothetical protein
MSSDSRRHFQWDSRQSDLVKEGWMGRCCSDGQGGRQRRVGSETGWQDPAQRWMEAEAQTGMWREKVKMRASDQI